MIGIPMNSSSIHISTVKTGCCKSEFDRTYPIQLNGIISPEEYSESIDKINRNFPPIKHYIIATLIFSVIIIVFTVIWGIVEAKLQGTPSDLNGTTITIIVVLSVVFSATGVIIISMERSAMLRKTIAEESEKYVSRSPTPCGWRLEITRYFIGRQGTWSPAAAYQILIDIGRSSTNNQNAYGVSYQTEQQSTSTPPSYSQISNGTCSKCSKVRIDPSAKFCTSCGQIFHDC